MAKDRLLFILSFLSLGILAAYLFGNREPQKVETPPPVVEAPIVIEKKEEPVIVKKRVLTAEKALTIGSKLSPGDYRWTEIEDSEINPTLIIRSDVSDKWINHASVVKEVAAGDRIKRRDILWDEEMDKKVVLDPEVDKVGVPFGVKNMGSFSQYLQPGKFINIIFTTKPDMGFGTLSTTLLKHVRIIGAEGNFNLVQSSEKVINLLLEMSPKEAEILSFAQEAGSLSVGVAEETQSSEEESKLTECLINSKSAANFHSTIATHLIQSLFPNVDVRIDATTKGFIVSGKVTDPQVAQKIMEILQTAATGGEKTVVNLMEVVPQQVFISVTVLEIDTAYTKDLGLNWKALFDDGSSVFGMEGVFPRPTPLTDPNYALTLSGNPGNFNLSYILDALQQRGVAQVIAEPNLSTTSGQPAIFFAGGEFPILIPQGGTYGGTVTVIYKQYGVILNCTPVVDLNGLITLHIIPEVSRLDPSNSVQLQGFDIPALITRRADTMVKLWPGQSYAIAGLIQNEEVSKVYGICGLNNLPVVGGLFRQKHFDNQKTELMIILTPHLIHSEKPVLQPCTLPFRKECFKTDKEWRAREDIDVNRKSMKRVGDLNTVLK